MWVLDDVIAAVASAPGAARRGIVRASGPGVQSVIAQILDSPAGQPHIDLHPPRATRVTARLCIGGLSTPLPASLFLWPDHRSYAGQPTVEIHTIGSPPILNAIVEELVRRGARVARPGEFTLRAFLAGKIDLVQAEAVLGVIDADSPRQLQQALTQLAGGVSSQIRNLREQLLIDLADLEAGLDFVEEDIEFVDRAAMTARLQSAVDWLTQLAEFSASRGQSTGRKMIVLAGLPNAGKSTLFNALAGRDAAVVSPIAGTTRDWLTATVDIGGQLVDLVDTAGAEQADSEISSAAQRGRREQVQQADLVVWCEAENATDLERQQNSAAVRALELPESRVLTIRTKCDLSSSSESGLRVSAATGAGLSELKTTLALHLATSAVDRGELISSTLARCAASLDLARNALGEAARFSSSSGGEELVAFELRRGLEALGEIAGVVYTDDLLDRIFSRFCIGK